MAGQNGTVTSVFQRREGGNGEGEGSETSSRESQRGVEADTGSREQAKCGESSVLLQTPVAGQV